MDYPSDADYSSQTDYPSQKRMGSSSLVRLYVKTGGLQFQTDNPSHFNRADYQNFKEHSFARFFPSVQFIIFYRN